MRESGIQKARNPLTGLNSRRILLLWYWIGLDWIGWDGIGLDWIGLVWIGLDWIGLDCNAIKGPP